MRGRSSSMDITKVNEGKQEPCSSLSSAYIRTLVKHLTSKDSIHSDGGFQGFVTTQNAECCNSDENKTEKHKNIPKQPQVHKKQVRRRLHTSRPYQERLLNMAEARREIVTALKFHRASMKQQELATNHNLLDTQSPEEKKTTKSRKIQSLYSFSNTAATTTTDTNSCSSLSCPPPPHPFPYWPISTLVPPPPPSSSSYHDNQDFILPSQTLGLNLNFQNFDNLDHPNLYHKPLSVYSTSSSSSTSTTPSSSSSAALYTPIEKPNSSSSGGLHHAIVDDEEMEEIRSLGEQHQIEWNDTINLVTSARWCSFLKTMEIDQAEEGDEYDVLHQFDPSTMEFPPWLNDSSCMQHLDDHFSDAYLQDSTLPCMDIGEIEAMDGEWLA